MSLDEDAVSKAALSFWLGSSATPYLPAGAAPVRALSGAASPFAGARIMNLPADGRVPISLAPFFASARLFGLGKAGGGIRPIAVGETPRRVVGKALLVNQTPFLTSILAPHQVGVGIPNACELIVLAVRERGAFNSGSLCLVQLDITNAFNSLRRGVVFRNTQACPRAGPLG